MVNVEPGQGTEIEDSLGIDESLVSTGEVVLVTITYVGGREQVLRIPILEPTDARNEGGVTYKLILEHVDDAYAQGMEGHIQLPHQPPEDEYSTMVYALTKNIESLTISPPEMEE
jgi:hypothetical protein